MINKNLFFYLFNWFSFYVYWVICIWGAGNNDYFWGPLIGALFIILHIVFIKDRFKEIKYILICILLGFIIQSLFYYLGIYFEIPRILPISDNINPKTILYIIKL